MSEPTASTELGYLRHVIRCIAKKEIAPGPFGNELLRAAGLARAKMGAPGLVGITPEGIEPFEKLVDLSLKALPAIERGTSYATFDGEVFSQIIAHFWERDAASITMD